MLLIQDLDFSLLWGGVIVQDFLLVLLLLRSYKRRFLVH